MLPAGVIQLITVVSLTCTKVFMAAKVLLIHQTNWFSHQAIKAHSVSLWFKK